jgi:hypothetical protein
MSLSPSTLVTRVAEADLVEADTGEGVVMLRMDDGICFGLNKVGTAIWRHLSKERSVADLSDALMRDFRVDRDTCERQLQALLEELSAERLIVVRAA